MYVADTRVAKTTNIAGLTRKTYTLTWLQASTCTIASSRASGRSKLVEVLAFAMTCCTQKWPHVVEDRQQYSQSNQTWQWLYMMKDMPLWYRGLTDTTSTFSGYVPLWYRGLADTTSTFRGRITCKLTTMGTSPYLKLRGVACEG